MSEKKVVVITGATSGIGAEFAKAFARQNYDLILTGRRKDKINSLAGSLQKQYQISVETVIAEFANPNVVDDLAKKLQAKTNIAVLVNNAGFGSRNKFAEQNLAECLDMIQVHDVATVRFTHAVLPNMIANNKGTIINVSSIWPFLPFGGRTIYAASKAFLNTFSVDLSKEVKKSGIKIQALCPGLVVSDFHQRPGIKRESIKGYKPMLASKVVALALKALRQRKVIYIPGFKNKLIVFAATLTRLWRT